MTTEEIIEEAKRLSTIQHVDAMPGTRELLEKLTPILSESQAACVFVALAVMLGGNLADAMLSKTQRFAAAEQRLELFTIIAMKAYEESYAFARQQGHGERGH